MEREASDIRRSSGGGGGAGEPSSLSAASSSEKHRCCFCKNEFRSHKALCGHMRIHPTSSRGVKPPHTHQAEQQQQGCCDVRGSAAAEESIIPVRELEEDVNLRRWESVVNQLLLLVEKSPQWPQGDDGGSSQNKNFITRHNSTTARGGGDGGGGNGEVIMKDGFNEPENISIVAAAVEAGAGAGVAVDAAIIAVHNNGTVLSDAKKKGSSSSAAGGGGAHTCEKCGRTFATGQSLGGHMRKHYDGPVIIANKKRTREQQPEETPAAPTVDRRVREPALPTAPLESYNPAPLSLSAQASDGGDCERNREEERASSSAGNGARRLLDLDLNKLAEPEEEEEEPKNAPQPEPERRDDDAFLSLRLGQFDIGKSSGV